MEVIKNITSKKQINLLRELVLTDFKLRYQGSALGYLWSLFKPLLLFGILYVVFSQFLRLGSSIPNYPVYLLLGIVFWSFFTEATIMSMQAIVLRMELVRKVAIPKYTIILSALISAFINLLLNSLVLAVFMFFSNVDISINVFYLPFFYLLLFTFSLSIGFILSILFVRYRDIGHIWEVLMQALFYLTPILWPIQLIPEKYLDIALLNPMAYIIQGAREVAISSEHTIASWDTANYLTGVIPLGIIITVMLYSVYFFKKHSVDIIEDL